MQTSGIKIDIKSRDFLIENSEKIEKVIKFAVKQAVAKLEKKPTKSEVQTKENNDRSK
jgi:hypothetical protein